MKNNQKKIIDQKDIAKKLGVSQSTVSRTIANSKMISGKTKKRIMSLVDKYEYTPNFFARGLITNKSYAVGLIIKKYQNLKNYITAHTMFSIGQNLEKLDYKITILSLEHHSDYLKTIRKWINEKSIDGFFLIWEEEKNDYLIFNYLNQIKFPAIIVNSNPLKNNIPNVCTDNALGMEKLTEYVISKGHKKIGFIAGLDSSSASHDRTKSFQNTMRNHGLAIDKNCMQHGDFTENIESGYHAALNILKEGKPTAIIAAADYQAIGAIKACQEKGYKVPDDIGIVGFDDIDMSSLINPKLTTVRQDIEKIGKISVDMLLDMANDNKANQETVLLEPELVIRESI